MVLCIFSFQMSFLSPSNEYKTSEYTCLPDILDTLLYSEYVLLLLATAVLFFSLLMFDVLPKPQSLCSFYLLNCPCEYIIPPPHVFSFCSEALLRSLHAWILTLLYQFASQQLHFYFQMFLCNFVFHKSIFQIMLLANFESISPLSNLFSELCISKRPLSSYGCSLKRL